MSKPACNFLQDLGRYRQTEEAVWKEAERERRLGDDCAPFSATKALSEPHPCH